LPRSERDRLPVVFRDPVRCDPFAADAADAADALMRVAAPSTLIRGPIIPEPLHVPASVTVSRPSLKRVPAVLRFVSVVRIASQNRFEWSSEVPRYCP